MRFLPTAVAIVALATPSLAQTPRDLLIQAGYQSQSKADALAKVNAALRAADAGLKARPGDPELQLQRALAIGYRGKLTRSRHDVVAARRALEAIVATHPRHAEAQLALGGWHLSAIENLGLVAKTVLGAREAAGHQALNRAVALGRGSVLIPAYASMTLVEFNPKDTARPLQLAQAALAAPARSGFDQRMKQAAAQLVPLLRAGNGKAAAQLASKLKPFGRIA